MRLLVLVLLLVACSETGLQAVDDDDATGDDTPSDRPPVPDDLDDLADVCEPIAWIECDVPEVGDSSDPAFGRTDDIDFWPVSQGNYRGPEVAYAWEADRSGTVTWKLVSPRPLDLDQDLFVLDGTCKPEDALLRGFNDVVFTVTEGDILVLVLDGFDRHVGEYEVVLECD